LGKSQIEKSREKPFQILQFRLIHDVEPIENFSKSITK